MQAGGLGKIEEFLIHRLMSWNLNIIFHTPQEVELQFELIVVCVEAFFQPNP